ncbi:selenoprotein T [Elysia marginata]|uniref:Selenoprotein T n=1 Tax=Elysia marginata TaxID=1093978 RepID=A0AAV4IPU5_9GAST|nr:selenoprotein T [Elysia marginata]
MRASLAQFIGIAKFVLIGLVVIGYNPFPMLNIDTPSIFTWALENKLYACLMLFFISNAIEGQLISTGAFEILYNDVPIWSKLETGRIPSPSEMFQMIENNVHTRLPRLCWHMPGRPRVSFMMIIAESSSSCLRWSDLTLETQWASLAVADVAFQGFCVTQKVLEDLFVFNQKTS